MALFLFSKGTMKGERLPPSTLFVVSLENKNYFAGSCRGITTFLDRDAARLISVLLHWRQFETSWFCSHNRLVSGINQRVLSPISSLVCGVEHLRKMYYPSYLKRNVVEQRMTTKQKIGMAIMIAIVLAGFLINAHLEYVVLMSKAN